MKQKDVDKIISDYYKSDKCRELEEITNKWNELEYFNKWDKKVRDAFYAHKLGMYSLSVPVWALMIEAIIWISYSIWYFNLKEPLVYNKEQIIYAFTYLFCKM